MSWTELGKILDAIGAKIAALRGGDAHSNMGQ